MTTYDLITGDCLQVLPTLPAAYADTVICDPPYGINFMSNKHGWDHGVPGVPFWEAALRVAKPGAFLLAFGGDRTHHRLMIAIEDAGWEIQTCLYWIFGSGFPKGLNVGKAIQKQFSADALCACGLRSTRIAQDFQGDCPEYSRLYDEQPHADRDTGPNAPPLSDDVRARSRDDQNGDVQASAQASIYPDVASDHLSSDCFSRPLRHPSTKCPGGDNAPFDTPSSMSPGSPMEKHSKASRKFRKQHLVSDSVSSSLQSPNNVMHSHPPYCATCGKPVASAWDGWATKLKPAAEIIILAMKPLEETYAHNALTRGVAGLHIDACRIGNEGGTTRTNGSNAGRPRDTLHGGNFGVTPLDKGRWPSNVLLDEQAAEMLGEQARFFYVAKPSAAERDAGLEAWADRQASSMPGRRDAHDMDAFKVDNHVTGRFVTAKKNFHPTVKPVTLLRYLARLTSSPTGGVILDPFMGSGSTGIAAILEGRRFVGIEQNAEYVALAEARLAHWSREAYRAIPVE